MEEIIEYFVECDCHTHLVKVTHWIGEDDTFVTWWEMGPNSNVSLSERIRMAWKALWRGYVADYELCLSSESRKKLIEALQQSGGAK